MDNVKVSDMKITSTRNGFIIHRWPYLSKVKSILSDSSSSYFRSTSPKISWMVQTRPDITFSVEFKAQVTEKYFYRNP